jgi:hypothetical protein
METAPATATLFTISAARTTVVTWGLRSDDVSLRLYVGDACPAKAPKATTIAPYEGKICGWAAHKNS